MDMPLLRVCPLGRLMLLTVVAAINTQPAPANINLELRPVAGPCGNLNPEFDLYAVSDSEANQSLSAMAVILAWDPTVLALLGINTGVQYPYQGQRVTLAPRDRTRKSRRGRRLRLRREAAKAPRRAPQRAGFTESAGPNGSFEAGPPVSAGIRASGSCKIVGEDLPNGKSRVKEVRRMFPNRHVLGFVTTFLLAAAAAALAGDWTNSGGNAGRNGQTDEIGPDSTQLLWSGGRQLAPPVVVVCFIVRRSKGRAGALRVRAPAELVYPCRRRHIILTCSLP
jgi:hypothetical protein